MSDANMREVLADATAHTQERLEFYSNVLDERLRLKDRWIADRFEDHEKRVEDFADAIRREIAALKELQTAVVEGEHTWANQRFEQSAKRFEDYVAATADRINAASVAHTELHAINEKQHAAFKEVIEQRLDQLGKILEMLREERGLFVLRDANDTKLEVIEKSILNLEKGMSEKIEIADKLLGERISKQESNLQVTNARNQQSIIALGILLTLVEVIIRFYQ